MDYIYIISIMPVHLFAQYGNKYIYEPRINVKHF